MTTPSVHLHSYDLPDDACFGGDIALDTEAMGLHTRRDRLCLVQLTDGRGDIHLVHFPEPHYDAPNLRHLLSDPSRVKLFHFARFDLAILKHYLDIDLHPVYCTKLASRLARTYTDRHGLKDLCKEMLGIELSKQQQSSDWGTATLSPEQLDYAATDVIYLHRLRERLDALLEREGRREIAEQCFAFLPVRVRLDLMGWPDIDIFAHS